MTLDVVAAMSEYRPYRDVFTLEEIIQFIKDTSGKKFEPEIVEICIKLLQGTSFQLN